jgi:hypothetical protein
LPKARVLVEQGGAQLAVARPTLELGQRDREVVQEEAPAAVVEVDRLRVAALEQVVLLMEVAMDQPDVPRLRAQPGCGGL